MNMPTQSLPLCVDLDGTLLKTDTLFETIIALGQKRPLSLLLIPGWLVKGKAYCKQEIAVRVDLDYTVLPYREDLVLFLQSEYQRGRNIVLATAADQRIARSIAEHLKIFTSVIASDGKINRIDSAKASQLVGLFGKKGFVYIGDNKADLSVWATSAGALVVSNDVRFIEEVKHIVPVEKIFPKKAFNVVVLLRELRSYQWVKNLLLLVPLAAAHHLLHVDAVADAGLAIIAFCLAASGVYLLNDLLDLTSDRHHPIKKNRPLAAGDMPLWLGIILGPLLWILSAAIASLLPVLFGTVLALYVLASFSYSWYLKKVVLIDVILLATLYTLRIFAGAAATSVRVSSWFLAFSLFLFLSLALLKRFAELTRLQNEDKEYSHGRGYTVTDRQTLAQLGETSGYISVLVLALYISSQEVLALYHKPMILWLTAPLLLYWISRMWLLAHRGKIQEDAIVFAMRDKISYIVLFATIFIALLAV